MANISYIHVITTSLEHQLFYDPAPCPFKLWGTAADVYFSEIVHISLVVHEKLVPWYGIKTIFQPSKTMVYHGSTIWSTMVHHTQKPTIVHYNVS